MENLTLTNADQGKSFEVQQGDKFTIKLDENPSTGYVWAVETTDDEIIQLKSSDYNLAPNRGMGGGGQRILIFEANKVGVAHLGLKRWRSWEGDAAAVEHYAVTIQVASS